MTKDIDKIKTTIVSYEEFSDYDFIPVANFFIKDALGQFIFIHSSDRALCQRWVDENYGVGKYKVVASKLQKTKSKLESGEYSCR